MRIDIESAILMKSIDAGHNYALDLRRMTGMGMMKVYRKLDRLEKAGFIKSTWKEQGPLPERRGPRTYYEVTGSGRQALKTVVKQSQTLLAILEYVP